MFEITFILELSAFVIGIFLINRISPKSYKLMVLLLALTVLNEGLSHYGFYKIAGLSKLVFYNLFFLVQYTLVMLIYLPVIRSRKVYLRIGITGLGGGIFILQLSGLGFLNPDYISLICLTLVIFSVFYLAELIYSDVILNLKSDPLFFFSIGLIVAQLFLLFYINAKRLESFRNDSYYLEIFKIINLVGNIIYYLSVCYSFLCTIIFPKRVGI